MLFLSIKPRYVERILSGEKQVEFRRRKPRSVPGDWLAIYESSPTMALIAIAQVTEVRVNSPRSLWRRVRTFSGVTKLEFDKYFTDSDKAVGIILQPPLELSTPISLVDLRTAWPRFNPPQGFLYLSDSQRRFVLDRVVATKRMVKPAA